VTRPVPAQRWRRGRIAAAALLFLTGAAPAPALSPLALHAGVNPVRDMAGDGKAGQITVDWRENGNAWSYHLFTVTIGGSVATFGDKERLTDSPHTGEDSITAVRFARGSHAGHLTTIALVASRKITGPVPDPAPATLTRYALVRNDGGIGTPYQFVVVGRLETQRRYCNADMALHTEWGLALGNDYDGARTPDGC
jgi:hypothetical protein